MIRKTFIALGSAVTMLISTPITAVMAQRNRASRKIKGWQFNFLPAGNPACRAPAAALPSSHYRSHVEGRASPIGFLTGTLGFM
ncbi:hypothetical protein LAC81_36575 (plasmid) [Ensifer adhaerens]|uniref:hypothetical protein n=1 Tax=Ensifer adhaerens TaxID=106592 RepID=UPI001CBEE5FE|nr:hypothetical protein [Ensifer adhaerens]MBZ7927455.1 hypothetical protein [Ensifer adhaerens]UAX97880.1 hypothetical protein LAC78_37880 [Ensifer adhaerens]UAY05259.1 hypothetical protein LAC80_36590 [Ensifer adhaerens]UAY12637.1 hypothetical protein LAC81_36575 [Ensifer adhaerens]